MTVVQIPTGADHVRMRAYRRHQATVVTIIGDIDLSSSHRVHDFATRFVLAGSALILDLSGVDFLAARGVSVLIAVDDACRTAKVPWILVPSRTVGRVLQRPECDTALPTASSVPEALWQLTTLTRARRRLAPVTTTAQQQRQAM